MQVETAAEMHTVVMREVAQTDIFVAAAAVADYAPVEIAQEKIKKRNDNLELKLTKTPDILLQVAARVPRPFTVGFAAETEKLEAHAREKLEKKQLDMVAANWVGNGRGFDRDDNALAVYWKDGAAELGNAPKIELARRLIRLVAEQYSRHR